MFGAFFTLAILASSSAAASAAGPGTAVILCGIVAPNPTTSGEGSGPRTYQLQVTSGPLGVAPTSVFAVAASIPLPTIGSYLCGQFQEGVPVNGLIAVLRAGDPGYISSSLPSTRTKPDTAAPLGLIEVAASLLLIGLVSLAAIGVRISPARCDS